MSLLQDKIIKALNSDFIGDVYFDSDEIKSMCQECQIFYKSVNQSWSKTYTNSQIELLIVTIVNVARKWGEGDEGRFWVKIFSEVFDDPSISPTRFYNEFEVVLKKYNKTIFISKGGKRMFREIFLLNAFAPAISVEAFIKLLWDLFIDEDVLDFSYQPQNDMYLQIAKMLARKFAGNENTLDDDVSFDGKTYSIRAAMKYACSQCPEQVAKIIDRTIREFDSIYFNGQQAENNYYSDICNSIVTKLFAIEHVNKGRRRSQCKEQVITDLTKIYAGYELNEDNQVCVFIPEIRIFNEDKCEVKVHLYRNSIPIDDFEYNVVGKDIRRKIKKIDISLTSYAEEFEDQIDLRITMEIDGIEVYDSKEKLFRDYVLFKSTREIKSSCKPGQYFLFYPYNLQIIDYTNIRNISGPKGFAVLDALEDDYISYKSKTVFFNTEIHNSRFNLGYNPVPYSTMILNEDEYDIYYKVGNCKMILVEYDTSKLVVIHNEKPTPMNLLIQKVEGNEITIDLSAIQANGIGFHKLVISEITALKKPLHRINYYINPQLHINFDKDYYFDNDVGSLSINYYGEILSATRVDASIDEFKVAVEDALLMVKVSYLHWRIDDGEWLSVCRRKPLWHESIHSGSIIEIDNQSNIDIDITIGGEKLQQSAHDNNKFLLGSMLTQISSNRSFSKVNIQLQISKKNYCLTQIDFDAEMIGEPFIFFDEKILSVDFGNSFIGPNNARFSLEFEDKNVTNTFNCGLVDKLETDDIHDGYYNLRISLISDQIYETNFKILRTYEDYIVGNLDKFYFDGVSIIVKSTKTEKGKIKFDRHVIENIIYVREELYPVYQGVLHIPKRKTMQVEIERKGINSIKIYALSEPITLLNVNTVSKELTNEAQNFKDIISCSSCYFDKEDK
ncbi:MAG: hypothetical protein PHW00_03780 [Clostridia bacterium]|nr:hypothetical protein [Clostridia bacterium]